MEMRTNLYELLKAGGKNFLVPKIMNKRSVQRVGHGSIQLGSSRNGRTLFLSSHLHWEQGQHRLVREITS